MHSNVAAIGFDIEKFLKLILQSATTALIFLKKKKFNVIVTDCSITNVLKIFSTNVVIIDYDNTIHTLA